MDAPTPPPAGRRLSPDELSRRSRQPHELREMPRRPVVAVLENIRSMFNVGSMFRSADGALLERLVLCGYTAHPPRKEIEKTALGAEDFVPWEYWTRAREACLSLREQGYQLLALEQTTHSRPLEEIPLRAPVAFVVGNEAMGVSAEVLEICDGALEIPMAGAKESLNVAVAFGLAAYGLCRRLEANGLRD